MSSLSDFAVGSNAFFLLVPLWLVWAGVLSRYRFQVLGLLVSGVASVYYHMCWSHEEGYCAGQWDTTARSVWLARDVMLSHFAVLLITSVLADQMWWKRSSRGERYMDVFVLGGSLTTFFLLWHFGDTIAVTAVLSGMNGLVLAGALWVETRRPHTVGWYVRGFLGAACIVVGASLKLAATSYEYTDDTVAQSDTYYLYHGLWHAFMGIGSFFFATLLEDLMWSSPAASVTTYTAVKQSIVRPNNV